MSRQLGPSGKAICTYIQDGERGEGMIGECLFLLCHVSNTKKNTKNFPQ